MENVIHDYWSQMPYAEAIRVGVVGLGLVGLRLAESISQKYPVYAFDPSNCLQPLHEVTQFIRGDIHWTASPKDLREATHIIITDPFTFEYRQDYDDNTQINNLLWATSIVRAAVVGRSNVTIIMASLVPKVGTTRRLLAEFHEQGHIVGVAPEFRQLPGAPPSVDPLPIIIAGIDRRSRRSIFSFYDSIFEKGNVFWSKTLEDAETFTQYKELVHAWKQDKILNWLDAVL